MVHVEGGSERQWKKDEFSLLPAKKGCSPISGLPDQKCHGFSRHDSSKPTAQKCFSSPHVCVCVCVLVKQMSDQTGKLTVELETAVEQMEAHGAFVLGASERDIGTSDVGLYVWVKS